MPQPFRNLTESRRVSLTPDEAEAIDAIAASDDRSVSYVLRQAVIEYLTTRIGEAKAS